MFIYYFVEQCWVLSVAAIINYPLANEVAKGYSNATFRNILVNTRINILQWILTNLGTYLVLKRIWSPIDFQGQRSRSKKKFCLSVLTSKFVVRFPPNFVEFKIMMCEFCSIKDFIVHWVLPLLCLFELSNFETIQYALCHRKFSYMINQKFMKLCTLQDPNMKMCTFSRS